VSSVRQPNFTRGRGFSLIEVTLALGVIAFALVAIMGLFPVAMKSATESQRETRATFIAQSVFADVGSGTSPTNTFIAIGTNFQHSSGRVAVNLKNGATNYLAFSEEGTPLGTLTASEFQNSIVTANSAYGAAVFVTQDATFSNLTRVEVQVEAPAAAPRTARTKYNFVTLFRNR
jgi:uncharacterized protein (TIGR02598 family)